MADTPPPDGLCDPSVPPDQIGPSGFQGCPDTLPPDTPLPIPPIGGIIGPPTPPPCPPGWQGAIGPDGSPCTPPPKPPITPPATPPCPTIPIPDPATWTNAMRYCGTCVNNTYNYILGGVTNSFNTVNEDVTTVIESVVNNIITEINDTIYTLNIINEYITNYITTYTDYVTETFNFLTYEINNITGGGLTIINPPPSYVPPGTVPPIPYPGPSPAPAPPPPPGSPPSPPPPPPPPPPPECKLDHYYTDWEYLNFCDEDSTPDDLFQEMDLPFTADVTSAQIDQLVSSIYVDNAGRPMQLGQKL
jgi:hypothetical protein